MTRLARSLPIAALLLALLTVAAAASRAGVQVMRNWKAMDRCAAEAQAAYPDFTAKENAKRNAKLKECLQQRNLPPRQ